MYYIRIHRPWIPEENFTVKSVYAKYCSLRRRSMGLNFVSLTPEHDFFIILNEYVSLRLIEEFDGNLRKFSGEFQSETSPCSLKKFLCVNFNSFSWEEMIFNQNLSIRTWAKKFISFKRQVERLQMNKFSRKRQKKLRVIEKVRIEHLEKFLNWLSLIFLSFFLQV